NRMAAWCLEYTLEILKQLGPEGSTRLGVDQDEMEQWREIVDNMYYPVVPDLGVFEQQDGFMDKNLLPVDQIPRHELPLNQNWSWDRILRSCFIKQADVLQGLFFLGDRYTLNTKKRN
ncbi:MAG TPA: family 65 glycosyl hydrolase, partial [Firmicutes bacterium]|nr:family 65 glycosyl hydrolase [Bacillota bacterium]